MADNWDRMKVVILAGGVGTRISEETQLRPKPMVEIGGKPILWHIMKIYSAYGLNDFVICCGYKGYMIKEYFANYGLHMSDVTFDVAANRVHVHANTAEPWKVTVVDTGDDTATGGRLLRVRKFLDNQSFCFTYGDGVGDINIKELIQHHRSHGRPATVTVTRPPGRFGVLAMQKEQVTAFKEKPPEEAGWISGGYFVLEPSVFDYIAGDATQWEREPMERLALDGKLTAFAHGGFWQPLDTLRDKILLNDLWASGKAPWKVWD
jgi:glucose-1-phosphate cytidylyltransferase